ncbi:MAG: hypothetical protein AELANPGJ_03218 [Anaerolineae bacterium]|nr:hypothetical protein [Anaerolineae bacterium]
MNATLEAMARALFKSWFVDFDPVRAKAEGRDPAGMDAETAALFPDAFEDSPLGEIPRGWRVGTVVDLCESIANGSTPSRKRADYWVGGDIDWFKTGELNDSILIASEEKITTLGLNESSCKLWPESTVLVALYASPTVGRLGMLSKVATANQACSGLVARQDIGHWYVFHAVLFERDRLQSYAVGAAQQNISQRVLSAHPVVVPNHVVCRRYHQLVLSLFERVQLNLEESIALAEMRDTLLPRLMRGELVGV